MASWRRWASHLGLASEGGKAPLAAVRCSPSEDDRQKRVQDDVGSWAELEFAAWRMFELRGQALAQALRPLASCHTVFFFEIEDGRVTYDDKAGEALPPDFRSVMTGRCECYRAHIEQALARIGYRGRAALAIELADLGIRHFGLPVFAFQKVTGANTMLLPDIDFFGWNFYEAPEHADSKPFDAKSDTGIFVGSTTGDLPITAAHVHGLRNRRLRSAVFFQDHPQVTFDLPNIVQCDTPETEALVRALNVSGERRGWPEQTGSKFILSMDGNGATCSRVVLALRSNGVLLKYTSDYQLYYFHGLRPWLHYVPISDDADVATLLAQAGHAMPLYRDIAGRSREFAETRLSRESVLLYTTALLDRYLRRFFD